MAKLEGTARTIAKNMLEKMREIDRLTTEVASVLGMSPELGDDAEAWKDSIRKAEKHLFDVRREMYDALEVGTLSRAERQAATARFHNSRR